MEKQQKQNWTIEEINILKENYTLVTCSRLQQKFFPNRSIDAIQLKARKIGLRSNYPGNRELIFKNCEYCHQKFQAKIPFESKYCSAACKTNTYRSKHQHEEFFIQKQKEYIRHSRIQKPQTENNRRWYKNNPLKVIAKNSTRRAFGTVDQNLIANIFSYYYNTCVYCGIYLKKPTLEHILPIKRGGDNSFENLAAACATCNMSKGQKTLLEFLLYRKI